ncbi:hypothetical protein BDB01DRAFT_810694 [Pilobolus umbonatus]|nr:hypothetical protein BDB01DRAFT_810694 [Pilobolus umbonatus]
MYYSFEFVSNVTHLCMDEIRNRGLQEYKIFRKSVPHSGLKIKVFNKQVFTREDLAAVNIHSIATLMQDVLWCSHDRIITKKAWRTINYETCTLSNLSNVISIKSEELVIDILDFLVELMQYQDTNLTNAYILGDSLGKALLGPADCSMIITEKAGHFLTRMIIEHAKIYHRPHKQYGRRKRIDSGFDSALSCHQYDYHEYHPICKAEGTQARARYYDRQIGKKMDWIENTIGVKALLDAEYPDPIKSERWISIFTPTEVLLLSHEDTLMGRILREVIKKKPTISSDPFAASYLFDNSKVFWVEQQLKEAFMEFYYILHHSTTAPVDKSNPLKKLNLAHIKLNIKKYRSRHDLSDEASTIVDDEHNHRQNMKNVMKKVIGGITQQGKDRRNKILV